MYSNAVKIAGLNDYLNPSEECVLPLVKNDNKYEIKINDRNSDSYTLKNRNKSEKNILDDDIYKINNLKVGNVDKNKRVTVGLSDCLSCSGCLTSSEEILLKDDNHLRVLEKMKEAELCVVSISPQTIFMFSSYFDEDPKTVLRKLSYFFRKLGATFVFDIGLAELLSLNLSKEEFISKFLKQNKNDKKDILSLTNDNNKGNSTNIENNNDNTNNTTNSYSNNNNDYIDLPIISSHCPGWTLYAEKTLEQNLVGKISRIPSSQVIQGFFVKILGHTINYYNSIYEYNYLRLLNPYLLFNNWFDLFSTHPTNNQSVPSLFSIPFNNIPNLSKVDHSDKVYHICVVPCYDKKFEMVRSEYKLDSNTLSLFYNNKDTNKDNSNDSNKDTNSNNNNYKDKEQEPQNEKESLVDDILSTGDIGKILDEFKMDFGDLKEDEIDYLFDYIYYFNKFVTFKLFGERSCSINNHHNNTTNSYSNNNNDNTNNTTNSYSNNDNTNNTNNSYSNNNNYSHNKNYFDSYRDCLDSTNLRDLVRCSELYCQSGGFAEEIFRHSCTVLFSKSPVTIHFKETINQDFKECLLHDSNNNVLLRFIIAYGFKNIQNIIRLLKPTNNTNSNNNSDNNNKEISKNIEGYNNDTNKDNSSNNSYHTKVQSPVYHYIELMSCPGGCFNGAGQRIERSLVDNLDNTNTNDYFNLIINKVVPKKYQNSMKLQVSKILERVQMGQVTEKLENIIKIVKIIKNNTYNDYNINNENSNINNNKHKYNNNTKHNNDKENKKNKIRNKNNNTKVQPQQIDMQATSTTAYEIFLKESKYISTEDPVCQYFSNFLKLSKELYDFKLNLNSHKDTSVSLKW